MSTPNPFTQAEQEFLGQLSGFAARHAQNKLFITTVYSRSLGAPVLVIVALGEQAEAMQHLVLQNQAPVPEGGLEIVKSLDSMDAGKW